MAAAAHRETVQDETGFVGALAAARAGWVSKMHASSVAGRLPAATEKACILLSHTARAAAEAPTKAWLFFDI